MGMDLYKSQFLDGCHDGSGTKTNLYKPLSQIVWAHVSIFLVLNVHIPAYLGSKRKPFFWTNIFFGFFVGIILSILIRISIVNCQFFICGHS
jgi:hypothetical protein